LFDLLIRALRFKYRLALHLGKTLGEIDELSGAELNEWAEYFSLEPPLSDRLEVQLARLTSIVYNALANKPLDWKEFLISKTKIGKKEELREKFESFIKRG